MLKKLRTIIFSNHTYFKTNTSDQIIYTFINTFTFEEK